MLRNVLGIMVFLFALEGAWAQMSTVRELRTEVRLTYRDMNTGEDFNWPQEVAKAHLERVIASFVPETCNRVSLYRLSPWNPADSVNGVARYHEYAFYCEHIFGPAYDSVFGGGNTFTIPRCPDGWDIDGSEVGDAKNYWCKKSVMVSEDVGPDSQVQ
jgi:hypothetical protein